MSYIYIYIYIHTYDISSLRVNDLEDVFRLLSTKVDGGKVDRVA
jgi:hypothetical protein